MSRTAVATAAKCFKLLILCVFVLICEGQNNFAAAELKFEMENPFRFYRFASDYAAQRIAFDLELLRIGGNDRSKVEVVDVEKLLNSDGFWTRQIDPTNRKLLHWPKSWSGATPLEIVENLRKAERRSTVAAIVPASQGLSAPELLKRFGWASLLDTQLSSSETAVCWSRDDFQHNNCTNYISPKSWRVRIFDDGDIAGNCSWQLEEGAVFTGNNARNISAPCDELYIDLDKTKIADPSLVGPSGRTRLTRTNAGGGTTPLEISLSDKLVIGIGDSYSSGEGNPDRPVVLSPNLAASQALLPRRPGENLIWAAQWIDRSCHRSVYSWQFRSAIQQTLVEPQNPITFLSYACSGAEVVEGLLFPWHGPEPTKKNSAYQSQLAAIYEELCAVSTDIDVGSIPATETDDFLDDVDENGFPWQKSEAVLTKRAAASLVCAGKNKTFVRPINAVLMSIGGNDIGFARWIAGAITSGKVRDLAGGFIPRLTNCGEDQDACDLTKARLARLKSRFTVLRRVLEDRVLKDGNLPASKLLVIAYPRATSGADGNPCRAGNEGMTVSTWPGILSNVFKINDEKSLKTIDDFRADPLVRMIKEFADRSVDSFTFLNGFVEKFRNHGFCATNQPNEAKGIVYQPADLFNVPQLSGTDATETLHLPRVGAPKRRGERVIDPEVWRPFPPSNWRPYASRSRWLRTPNDVFMTVNNKPSVVEEGKAFGILDLNGRATSGAFHPTAEGHAAIATVAAPALTAILH